MESLLVGNKNLHEKLKQVEADFSTNRRWSSCSQVLNWPNTHHKQGKKDLGFVNEHTVYPVNRKYVGLYENIVCFHCGKIGHYRYACSSRKYAIERNLIYIKQIWVRKDEICMSNGKGPKWIGFPKLALSLFCKQ